MRFTKDEAADLDAACADAGLNRSEYLRLCFTKQRAAEKRAAKRRKGDS